MCLEIFLKNSLDVNGNLILIVKHIYNLSQITFSLFNMNEDITHVS
jgi:hypothetical protein